MINRTNELAILNEEYKKDGLVFSVIYGEYGVGKTTLLSKFMENKPHVYFSVTLGRLELQYLFLAKQVLKLFSKEELYTAELETFEKILEFLRDNIQGEKLVFVIDGVQNLYKLNKNFSSEFAKHLDNELRNTNIHLVISGSESIMYSEIINQMSPLFGRNSTSINLTPLPFESIKELYPAVNKEEQMRIFSIFGTKPLYLSFYNGNLDYVDNLEQIVLDKHSYLYIKPQLLLATEVGEENSMYFAILDAIAQGNTKVGKIAKKVGVEASMLPKYFQKLIKHDILYKELPILTYNVKKSRYGRYKIKDRYLLFWFTYIYRNFGYLELTKTKEILDEIINTFDEKIVLLAFKDYIKEAILLDPEKYIGFKPSKIGKQWTNQIEIDLVAFNDTDIAYIECRWDLEESHVKVTTKLEEKAKRIKAGKRVKHYFVFTRTNYLKG